MPRRSPGFDRMRRRLGKAAEDLRQDTLRLQEEAMRKVPRVEGGTSQTRPPRRDDEYPKPEET